MFEPLTKADYKARMISFDIKPNKAGTGTNGNAQFEVLNGESKGRRLFHCFLIEHPDEKAVGFSTVLFQGGFYWGTRGNFFSSTCLSSTIQNNYTCRTILTKDQIWSLVLRRDITIPVGIFSGIVSMLATQADLFISGYDSKGGDV